MDLIELSIVSVLSCVIFYLLQYLLGRGYVSRREFNRQVYDIDEGLKSIDESFVKFRTKYTTRFGREQKEEEMQILTAQLPDLIDKLPIKDEQKELIKKIPPDLLLKYAQKFLRSTGE